MFPWTFLLLFVFCFLVFIFLSYLALSVTKHTIETPLLISYTCIALYSLHTLPCLLQSIPGGTPPLTSYIAPSWHRTLLDQLCLKLQYQKKKNVNLCHIKYQVHQNFSTQHRNLLLILCVSVHVCRGRGL